MIELYPEQLDALRKMHNGCILCGGVGSGKSITALAYYYLENGGEYGSLTGGDYVPMGDDSDLQDLYIITTAHKRDIHEWETELANFLLSPNPENNLYHCNKVVIDSWNNIGKYTNVDKQSFFIFDEQRVVGSGAWVKAFLKIARLHNWILLSATPGDTWSDYIPVFIANGYYKNKTEFVNQHVVYSRFTKFPKIDKYLNTGRLLRLRSRVLVDMNVTRHTVRHDENVFVDFDMSEYKSIIKNRWNPWKDCPIQNVAELCYSLRKIVNSDESRITKILEIFESRPRLIIFYNFDYELDILQSAYWGEDVEIAEWNGHKHQDVPKSESWVYFVQYNAGAEAWNCVTTDTIVFYSQNYSYKIMEQARGRIDRLNTLYTDLYYYHIKSRSGIDLAISKALNKKKKFNEGAWAKQWN